MHATRNPEAVPLRSIDAEHVAEELIKIFAQIGVPEEILTDQGSNFMSKLLAELYSILHIHFIRMYLYYPQTDGLVHGDTKRACFRIQWTRKAKTGTDLFSLCYLFFYWYLKLQQDFPHLK